LVKTVEGRTPYHRFDSLHTMRLPWPPQALLKGTNYAR
jgi:hypothetical protein